MPLFSFAKKKKKNQNKGSKLEEAESPPPPSTMIKPSALSTAPEKQRIHAQGSSNNTDRAHDNLSTLESLYIKISESAEVNGKLEKMFKHVRIMVVGRSGSGKTTVIRLVVGEKGPRSMSTGQAGVQDISVEWHHPDPDLPLIFHDSNGMDVLGAGRLKDIEEFVGEHQSSSDFNQRIHVVWYVFSAADTRFLDDGGLLEMLDRYPNLPILLVMTFNDLEALVRKNVERNRGLDRLLERISDPAKRQRIRGTMVRLGNDVQQLDDGSLEGRRDLAGLQALTHQTKALIGKDLHATWIACQATDLNEKLNASAQLIISLKRSELFSTCLLGAMPVVQQTQLGYMLLTVTKGLAKIWRIPINMEKAILKEFFISQGGQGVLKNLLYNMGAAIGLAGTITAAVFTAGAAAVAVAGVLVASAFAQMRGTSALVMSYSVLVLGVILYVKALQPARDSWDHDLAIDRYSQHCQDFATSEQATQLQSFVKDNKSWWESTTKNKEQASLLKMRLVAFFKQNILLRPTSFFSMMQQDDAADDYEYTSGSTYNDAIHVGKHDGNGDDYFDNNIDEDLYEFDDEMYAFDDL